MEQAPSVWTSKPTEFEYGSPQWVVERDRLIAVWEADKVKLETAKADEMESRKAVVDFSFDPENKKGTERIALHNGFELKTVKKLNYSFMSPVDGVEVVDAVDKALQQIEAMGDDGKFIAERLVKWSATLSMTEYNALAPQYKTVIDTVIKTTEGAPTLEIVAPKGTKK